MYWLFSCSMAIFQTRHTHCQGIISWSVGDCDIATPLAHNWGFKRVT